MGCMSGEEATEESLMEAVFHTYLDSVLEDLVDVGLSEDQALSVIFEVADQFSEREVLPEFPHEDDYAGMGRWVVKAQDARYHEVALQVGSKIHGGR